MEGWIDEWLLFGTATAGRSCPNHLNDGTPFTMSPYGPGSLLLSGRASRGKEGGPADDNYNRKHGAQTVSGQNSSLGPAFVITIHRIVSAHD